MGVTAMAGVALGTATGVDAAEVVVAARVGATVGTPVAVTARVATGLAVGVPSGAGEAVGVDMQPPMRSAASGTRDLIAFINWSRFKIKEGPFRRR